MGLLETIDESTSKVAGKGEEYIRATKEYYELKVFQQLTTIFSYFCKVVIFGSILALGVIFMAISGAKVLGEVLESTILGYLSMGLLLFVLFGFIYLGRRLIDRKIIEKLAKSFLNDEREKIYILQKKFNKILADLSTIKRLEDIA